MLPGGPDALNRPAPLLRSYGLAPQEDGGSCYHHGRAHGARETHNPPEVAYRVLAYVRVGMRQVALGGEAGTHQAYGQSCFIYQGPNLPGVRQGGLRVQLDGVVAETRQPTYRPREVLSRSAGDDVG